MDDESDLTKWHTDLPLLEAGSVDFKRALAVVNRSRRFIIPVPVLVDGGEPLVFPSEAVNAGEPLKAYDHRARGVVFFNATDNAWQGVQGNGRDGIIVNEVDETRASALKQKYLELVGNNPSLQGIKALLEFARTELGLKDFYNKQMASIERQMKVLDDENPFYREVSKPDIHKAVYFTCGFRFNGPVHQIYPRGGVIVKSGRRCWGIEPGVFQRNFRKLSGGKELELGTLEAEFKFAGVNPLKSGFTPNGNG